MVDETVTLELIDGDHVDDGEQEADDVAVLVRLLVLVLDGIAEADGEGGGESSPRFTYDRLEPIWPGLSPRMTISPRPSCP